MRGFLPGDVVGDASVDSYREAQSAWVPLVARYGVDPFELVSVAEIMTNLSASPHESAEENNGPEVIPEVVAYSDETTRAVAEKMATSGATSLVVVDRETGQVRGSIRAEALLAVRRRAAVRESVRSR
jgi:CBS domain-containing protein